MACGGIAHAISGEDENGFYASRASETGRQFQARQPEPAAVVAGSGAGGTRPGRGGADWRHGPTDPARLGSPLQRAWPRWFEGQLVEGARAAADLRSAHGAFPDCGDGPD